MSSHDHPADGFRSNMGVRLPVSCREDFKRLKRTLVHGPAFQWLLVDSPDAVFQAKVMCALDHVAEGAGFRVSRMELSESITDAAALEDRLVALALQADVVHLIGAETWFDTRRWEALNIRRERLAHNACARFVVWLDAHTVAQAAERAPDLWAWRSGVYRFEHRV